MAHQLSNPRVEVNNETIFIVPNSLKFTEGKGEQAAKAASGGGGSVEFVYAEDIETKFSKVSFDVFNDIDSIEKANDWKALGGDNLVQVTGRTPDGKTISRTFSKAGITNDYEVPLGKDTPITLEFQSKPAI